MKKRILPLALAGCILLSGCKAMLERSYSVSTPHAGQPATAEDPSVLRVENYRELVSAVLYLVTEGAEEGTIQLYNYSGEEESDLSAACLEVSTQDPLGAYAVDYIKHELSRVVSYYQATLAIRYRRSEEQREGIVRVDGDGNIRERLGEALAAFSPEIVLRTPFFFGDEESIETMLLEAYYADPAAALGLPEFQVAFYPDSGWDRIVEVTLTYPEDGETLEKKREELSRLVSDEFTYPQDMNAEAAVRQAVGELGNRAVYDPQAGSTAYAALAEGTADDEGLALACALVCRDIANVSCEVLEGTLDGEKRMWNRLRVSGGTDVYVDLSRFDQLSSVLCNADEMVEMGYRWEGQPEEKPAAGEEKEEKNGPKSP